MQTSPIHFGSLDDSEELARAELYGLLSRLWLAPPDAALMQEFSVAVTQAPHPGGLLEEPWAALVGALRSTSVEAAAVEHVALFHGVGKPEVFAYASFHLSGFLNEKPLAALRHDLADLGLARDSAALETEDHIAYLFEVMRYLIAGDDAAVCNLEQQRRFYRAHLHRPPACRHVARRGSFHAGIHCRRDAGFRHAGNMTEMITRIDPLDITGLILCGGRGTRMGGVDKGLQNHHGMPLALAMSYVKASIPVLASISERRLNKLVDPATNDGLPPFLIGNEDATESGFMIVQYTAAAIVNDLASRAHPASVYSIPTSANAEDHVSMGANEARHVLSMVDDLGKVLALELIVAARSPARSAAAT